MSRKCPKCADERAAFDVKYDKKYDELKVRCCNCGYQWTEEPADLAERRFERSHP